MNTILFVYETFIALKCFKINSSHFTLTLFSAFFSRKCLVNFAQKNTHFCDFTFNAHGHFAIYCKCKNNELDYSLNSIFVIWIAHIINKHNVKCKTKHSFVLGFIFSFLWIYLYSTHIDKSKYIKCYYCFYLV